MASGSKIRFLVPALAAWLLLTGLVGPVHSQEPSGKDVQRVIIDPGHGVDDPGVIGPDGLAESALTWDLALSLQQALTRDLGLQVFLTRDQGTNPPLEERTAMANRFQADLVISIHAGGATSDSVSGFRVYFQDYQPQHGALAEASDIRPGSPPPWDLAQRTHLKASQKLAEELNFSLTEVLRQKGLTPQGLPLALLAGIDRPAVLLEVGTLTNSEEERNLKSQGFRDALVKAMVRGVNSWRFWFKQSYNQPDADTETYSESRD